MPKIIDPRLNLPLFDVEYLFKPTGKIQHARYRAEDKRGAKIAFMTDKYSAIRVIEIGRITKVRNGGVHA